MTDYIFRRLLLLPLTLFAIILVNFIIINLAPGDPTTVTEISSTGGAEGSQDRVRTQGDTAYLQFREHYGLTLPILLNFWPWINEKEVLEGLQKINNYDSSKDSVKNYFSLRLLWGDRARFLLPHLLKILKDRSLPYSIRKLSLELFVRGGTRQGNTGSMLTLEERAENRKIAADNLFLQNIKKEALTSEESLNQQLKKIDEWYMSHRLTYQTEPSFPEQLYLLFLETRFSKYMRKVLTLDFGTLRSDPQKTVISEVVKRLKYSLTLSVIPMIVTFLLCQIFGMIMAVKQNRPPDVILNTGFLMLFAIPIFVVAPFLIEKIALKGKIPLTNISFPIGGFTSAEEHYQTLTSIQRFGDIALHIFLPLVAIIYGTLAIQSRLSRTAALEVLRQDYVRTAKAKGLPLLKILITHVGRNGAITIITSLAASLGVILGGSLIVETIFQINGFGYFFYQAIVNRDYNVILFSAFAGSLLTLVGYLLADIAYTLLDPRVSLE